VSTVAPRADAAAASVGATDLFVLRRVSGNRFVHFGGSGRGSGWAGLIEVAADEEGSLRDALATRRPARHTHGGKELVFGPYYAQAAAFVPVTNDVVVVFGGEDAMTSATDEALQAAATLAADAVESRRRRSSPTSWRSSMRCAPPWRSTRRRWRRRCVRSRSS